MKTHLFTIRSCDDGSTLSLSRESEDYWAAVLKGPRLAAEREVYAYSPHDDFRRLFAEMAKEWRGWEGEKTWSSLEGELRLSCTSDELGHITVVVVLQTATFPDAWEATGTLRVEAGQLQGLAKAAVDFLAGR